jgi:hypothetical protein
MNDAEVTFWPNLITPQGVRRTMPWGVLFAKFGKWRPFAGDKDHPGWSAGIFEPAQRGLEHVRAMSALVLDYDGGTPIDDVRAKWSHLRGFVHTTRKHTEDAPRCRVILPFSRLVTPDEYATIWTRRAPYNTDQATKDASRFWFVPGSTDEATFRAWWLDGEVLDVDAVLAEAPVEREQPRPAATGEEAERRASAYIAKMPPAISGAKGHQALWQVTLVAVCGFGLSEQAAFQLIKAEYNPRCHPAWRDREILHKIRDATRKAKVPFGFKLDEDRDWNRTPASVPRSDPDPTPEEVAREMSEPVERGDAWEPEDGAKPEPAEPVDAIAKYAVRSVAELLNGVFVRATTERQQGGCPSGVELIDMQLGGFRRGMVTILGASTSWGKSSFAILTSESSFAQGKRVILISGEDTEDTYGARFMARRASVNAISLRDNDLSETELSRMADTLNGAEQDPFFINGIGKTAEDLAQAIRMICAKRDIDLVIVDYLQAFSCARRCQDRRVEVTHIARTFVEAIKMSGSSGLVLSQLKRLDEGKPATMHDLKESGDLENMAEHIIVGWTQREGGKWGTRYRRLLSVEKNKDGPRSGAHIELEFNEKSASFTGRTVHEHPNPEERPS